MIGRRITPSMVVAAVALFAALGGSAFAVGSQTAKLGCVAGAVKAFVTIDVEHFTGAFPQTFSSDPKLFTRRYSCNGRGAEVRGDKNFFYVRFPGLPEGAPLAGTLTSTGGYAAISIQGDGSYKIGTWDSTGNPLARGFTLVIL
jgi:hypothetical protein